MDREPEPDPPPGAPDGVDHAAVETPIRQAPADPDRRGRPLASVLGRRPPAHEVTGEALSLDV